MFAFKDRFPPILCFNEKSGFNSEIIVYYGSGLSACPNVLALGKAGYKNVKLYAGSWSDWISYEGYAIAVVTEK